jgi:NADPH-dependent 2,4-dienoyl-CoA reductase/sulfur reductase-like enzyme
MSADNITPASDVLVIGAGPAGALAALRAADLGARTVLVTGSARILRCASRSFLPE